jgi:hypothetical protein
MYVFISTNHYACIPPGVMAMRIIISATRYLISHTTQLRAVQPTPNCCHSYKNFVWDLYKELY